MSDGPDIENQSSLKNLNYPVFKLVKFDVKVTELLPINEQMNITMSSFGCG